MKKDNIDTKIKTLENQEITADTASVPLSEKEIELLIDCLAELPITHKLGLKVFKKLDKGLESLKDNKIDGR